MGAALSSRIKEIDGGDASAKGTLDTLNALLALGETRVDAAYNLAMSDRGPQYAKISKIILRRQSIVCNASQDTQGITDGIKSSVGKLMSGQILDGVVDLIGAGLKVVLGESAGQISSNYTYALLATELGGLLRIDVDIYSFALKSQGVESKVQNMTAISSIISSVDHTSLTAGDIRAVISISYGGSTVEIQKGILEAVMSAWEMDERKAKTGEPLTKQDIAKHQALFVGSKYDAEAEAKAKANAASEPPK